MIQRIQTIYLLISLIAWTLLFFFPVLGFTGETGVAWSMFSNGIEEAASGKLVIGAVPMLILFILVELLALVSILAYKRRALQLRVTLLNMLLQLFSYGIIAVYAYQAKSQLGASPQFLVYTAIPLVAAICSYLAFRGIRRDILLLRAVERLR